MSNEPAESLPADVNADPSPAAVEPQPTAPVETPTPKVEQEVPLHLQPRFQEVIGEKNRLAEQNRQLMEMLQRQQTPAPVSPDDPIGQLFPTATPEERAALENLRKLSQREAEAVASKKEVEFRRQMDEQQKMTMAVIYQNFQSRHPEIQTGSQEEAEMLNMFRQGVPLDAAHKAVYAPINAAKEIEKVRQQYTAKQQQKVQANLETTSVSPTNGIPTKEKVSFRDLVARKGKELGVAGF